MNNIMESLQRNFCLKDEAAVLDLTTARPSLQTVSKQFSYYAFYMDNGFKTCDMFSNGNIQSYQRPFTDKP